MRFRASLIAMMVLMVMLITALPAFAQPDTTKSSVPNLVGVSAGYFFFEDRPGRFVGGPQFDVPFSWIGSNGQLGGKLLVSDGTDFEFFIGQVEGGYNIYLADDWLWLRPTAGYWGVMINEISTGEEDRLLSMLFYGADVSMKWKRLSVGIVGRMHQRAEVKDSYYAGATLRFLPGSL